MGRCYEHAVCNQGYIQSSEQLDLLMKCKVRRGVLVIVNGKYERPVLTRRT